MKDFKVGDRFIWKETWKENIERDIRGIVIDVIVYPQQNVIIQWYENGIKTRSIRYHICQIKDEKRIKIDKEHYRDQKLNELGI